MGTRISFPGGKGAGGVKLTTHLPLLSWSGIRGAMPLLTLHTFMAWCSVQAEEKLTLVVKVKQKLEEERVSLWKCLFLTACLYT